MFLLNHLAGVNGIVWATPAADLGAMAAAVALFLPFWRKLSRFERKARKPRRRRGGADFPLDECGRSRYNRGML